MAECEGELKEMGLLWLNLKHPCMASLCSCPQPWAEIYCSHHTALNESLGIAPHGGRIQSAGRLNETQKSR